MGVKVKFRKGAWWVFVHHHGRRKAKRIGDKETAQRVAQAIREHIARGDLNLEPAAGESKTLRTTPRAGCRG
jgi:integrase